MYKGQTQERNSRWIKGLDCFFVTILVCGCACSEVVDGYGLPLLNGDAFGLGELSDALDGVESAVA